MPGRRAVHYVPTETILSTHTPLVRETAARLRQVILDTLPDVQEVGYPGWHAIGYRRTPGGRVCAMFPSDETVQLVFEWGALLQDPDGLLRGSTKQTRFIEYRSPDEVREDALARLLLEAVALRA